MNQTDPEKKLSSAHTSVKSIGQAARLKARAPGLYEDKSQANMPRNVAIYVRVSTLEQAQGYSTDAQERLCREYIQHHKPNWTLVQVFRDEGQTGTNIKRPGFQEMLQAVYDGKVDAIVCHHLDRFSRSLHDIMIYFKLLEDQKVFLSFADEQFDFSTPEGRMHFNFLAIFADWYIKNLSRETKKGKSSLVQFGKQNNAPPFGYQKLANGTLEVIEEEAELIKDAFQKYASGNYTDGKIAELLNLKGSLTRRNRIWNKESVRTMLQLDFYYGAVKYLDTLYEGSHQPLISKELFDQVQIIRKAHAARPRTNTKNFERIYLLNGLIRCASCERNLRAQGYRVYRYYREASRLRGLKCQSSDVYVHADVVEQQVGAIVQAFEFPPEWKKEIRDVLSSSVDQQHRKDERKEILEKLKRLGDLYLDGMIERQAYLATREELNQRLGSMSSPEPTQIIETGQTLESFLQIWPLASESQRRDICHLMFEWVEADMEKARISRVMPRYEFTRFFEKNTLLAHDPRGGYLVKDLPGAEISGQV